MVYIVMGKPCYLDFTFRAPSYQATHNPITAAIISTRVMDPPPRLVVNALTKHPSSLRTTPPAAALPDALMTDPSVFRQCHPVDGGSQEINSVCRTPSWLDTCSSFAQAH
ncbi:unnamed protein product [Linum trigynum]|uniref:Uncharacterized protein n=1 Tax=Linum trigynum TaxID=586398 RepID=A0AAV2GIS1_9ROSI